MKSKVILFCVLLFCSKIVDSTPHSEDLVRQRVTPLSNWEVNQNAPNEQYLDTDFTQTRNVNIQKEKVQDYYTNQGRYNYDSNGYNRSPASSLSGEELLASYDPPTNARRLDSYPQIVKSYPSRTSQVGFDNQQYQNQNWRSQNPYTNSAPSAVFIPDDERPLVTTVQETYRSPVQYLKPKYVPSSNRRFYQPGRSYLTSEHPLTAPPFGSSGPVRYENYNEDQVAATEKKARPPGGRRYLQNIAPQSGLIYNEAPAAIATDTLTDQSENIEYAENYRSRSDSSNTATITNYDDGSPVISAADNYSSDSKPNNDPVPYESYREGQAVASEVNARHIEGRRYGHSFAPQSQIIYSEAPAVVVPADSLTDQSENIKYLENYKSHSHLRNTAPITNYDDGSPVISAADTYSSDSKPNNDPVPYKSYREGQATASEVKARPIGSRRHVHSFAPQSEIIYSEAPAGVATDSLTDQSENIKYFENYKLYSHLSNPAPITNQDDSSPLISEADNNKSDSMPSNIVHVNSKKEGPVVISKILSEKPLARRYANNYRSDSGWNNITPDDSSSGAPVVTETVEVKSGKYETYYRPKEPVPISTYSEGSSAPTDTKLLNSGNDKYEESNVAHYGSNSPTPLNTNPKQNVYQKITSGIKELNLGSLTANPEIQNILKGNTRRYVIIHSNGTVEHVDNIDLGSHQNPKLRLVHTKRKHMDHSDSDGVFTQQLPVNLSNNITKTPVPVDEYPLSTNNQSTGYKKPTPLHVDQANPADEYDSNISPPLKDQPADHSNLKPLPQPEKQSADNNNSKLLPSYVIPPADNDNSMPLTPNEDQSPQNDNLKPSPQDVNPPGDYHYSKPLTRHVNQSAADESSKPLPQDGNEPADGDNSKVLTRHVNQLAADGNSKPLSQDGNEPAYGDTTKLLTRHVIQSAADENSKPLPQDGNEPADGDNSKHETDSTSSKSKHSYNQPADYNNSNSSPNTKPLDYPENQQADDTDSKTLPAHEIQSADKNQPEEDERSKPLRRNENQPTDDLKSEPTNQLAIASKNDDQSNSTTVSPTVPNYTTSSKPQVIKTPNRKYFHRKLTTGSPVVSTTTFSDDTSEDQIITLSPIEQATDNVSDVPPVATTTTTTRPDESSGKSDIINDANNKQEGVRDDKAETYSTTTVSPSSSVSPTDSISDDKIIGTTENKNTETKNKTVAGQVNGKKDTHTAVYNSNELFDTNTDVPAKSDDYSSVTASPSVQNEVNTGDASGDNSLELGQSETDVQITVSSSTAYDSEDEIITINIEVSESTDDSDSSGNDKSLVISIDTNEDSADDSKTPKPEDCKENQNSNDGRGKNVEIDMSNLKGEPTMWIRTTNQDFIDKLTAKNDTEFDVIYFFHIDNQPAIEREKATTIYCNGTVFIETTEITYAHKDDATPTIVRTTKIMKQEDYEAE